MERIVLLTLIVTTWIFIVLVGRWLPWASALGILFVIMFSYMTFVSIAMVHRKRKELKTPPQINDSYQPKISILVPAHNEASVIAQTVRTLLNLKYPHYELLVIDDRSTDDTPEQLARLKQQVALTEKNHEKFKVIFRGPDALPGKSAVLNEAFAHATGDVIAVFDADAMVSPTFLSDLVPFLRDQNVGAVQARKVMANRDFNLLTRCQHFEYLLDAYFQCGRDTIRGAVELRGNGMLIKREALEAVNGWNNQTLTDDLDLSTRLHVAGFDIRFAHKVLVYEEAITRYTPLIHQRRRWAEGSLTRYLEYAPQVLMSDKASMRAKADLIAYIIEFLFPLWMVSDYVYLWASHFMGDIHRMHVLSSLFLLPVLAIFFYSMLLIALIRFDKLKIPDAMANAVLTAFYLMALWIPVSFGTLLKILFQKERSLTWHKTEHHGHHVPVQALQSLPEISGNNATSHSVSLG